MSRRGASTHPLTALAACLVLWTSPKLPHNLVEVVHGPSDSGDHLRQRNFLQSMARRQLETAVSVFLCGTGWGNETEIKLLTGYRPA